MILSCLCDTMCHVYMILHLRQVLDTEKNIWQMFEIYQWKKNKKTRCQNLTFWFLPCLHYCKILGQSVLKHKVFNSQQNGLFKNSLNFIWGCSRGWGMNKKRPKLFFETAYMQYAHKMIWWRSGENMNARIIDEQMNIGTVYLDNLLHLHSSSSRGSV